MEAETQKKGGTQRVGGPEGWWARRVEARRVGFFSPSPVSFFLSLVVFSWNSGGVF